MAEEGVGWGLPRHRLGSLFTGYHKTDNKSEYLSQESGRFLSRNQLTVFTHANNFAFADCDGIDEKAYAQLARTKSKYSCVLCRGEKQERMDSFHRKNRNKTT